MPAQDFAGRPIAEVVAAFTSGKVAARDIVEGLLERCARAEPYNPVATLEVLHHSKTLSARTWVALDGMVLRQEIPFPLLRLVLERRPPKARPRGLEPPPLSSSDVSPRSSRP